MTRLTGFGMARGEPFGPTMLELYARNLEGFADEVIWAVLSRAEVTPRAEYEPKIPELGALLAMMRAEVRKGNPYRACGECVDGWVIREVDGRSAAARCDCFLEWKKKCG